MKAKQIAEILNELRDYYGSAGIVKPIILLDAMIEDLLEDPKGEYELSIVIGRLMDQSYASALSETRVKKAFEFPNIAIIKPKHMR